jgi:hypothetical protein
LWLRRKLMPNLPSDDVDLRPAGPGAVEVAGDSPEPLLTGASEYEYVEIFNPLSVTFIGKFGISKPANSAVRISSNQEAPGVTRTEEDVRRNYGLDLRNPDHRGNVNIINKVEIPSGKTVRLLGNEAQVIVNQLVTEIMQRQNDRLLLSDPFARSKVEKDVVVARGFLNDILDRPPQTIQEQLKGALSQQGAEDEQAFPNIQSTQGAEPQSRNAVESPADNSFPDARNTERSTEPAPEVRENKTANSRSRTKTGQFTSKTANS